MAAQGGDVVGSTAAEFASFIDAERKRYATTVRDANITVE